jgi:hypothetical protein
MRVNPEKRAWYILLAAFAVFLLLCGSLAYGVYWFVFLSYAPMDITLEASRGTIQMTLPNSEEPIAVTDYRSDIGTGVTIQTDSISQGIVTFADRRTGEPVASITLFRDSQIELVVAQAPRFEFNRWPYIIRIDQQSGHADSLVLELVDDHTASILLMAPQVIVRLSEPGLYITRVSEREATITTREGLASVRSPAADSSAVYLESDARITVATGEEPEGTPERVENLMTNSLFSEDFAEDWDFYNDREPPGEAYNTVFDGRTVVAIDRSQERFPGEELGHAETGLVQFLNVDVSGYDSLEMRASFYVAEQSLSTCGIAGSECPMMVRMVYEDASGTQQVYIHGFYADHDPTRGYPLACDTCRMEHERVAPNTWHTFESGNLMTLLPNGQRPAYIYQVSFYASGHAYLTYVSEMSLMAEE